MVMFQLRASLAETGGLAAPYYRFRFNEIQFSVKTAPPKSGNNSILMGIHGLIYVPIF
jgi:hypothetical protein